ncbi:MAG: universal stress protein [Haloarculaceae archaeon]
MTGRPLLDRVFVPVASEEDARTTARAAAPHLRESDGYAVVGHVIEKAGGAPDKASVEQRERRAEDVFAVIGEEFAAADVPHECHLLYGTDVAERIIAAAGEHDADAIVFTPRGGSRWLRLLTGDVSLSLVTLADRPVVVLPDVEGGEADG